MLHNVRTSKKVDFYLHKLEWLGPILVRGLKLLSSVEALEQTFSFSQVMVLQALVMQREMRMNELAQFLGLSKPNATGLVDRLVKRGMVRRERSSTDRRVVLVQLTQSGRRATQRLLAQQRRGLAQMMKRVPERDLQTFIDTLEQFARGIVESQGDVVIHPHH